MKTIDRRYFAMGVDNQGSARVLSEPYVDYEIKLGYNKQSANLKVKEESDL
ncbi:MAG: hypothetical protein RIB71_25330 [Imperialibacter sp.]|uniref:hypothetical protein n=1 Tax=Imperialibacter sp. TaxID=2038411 RepID=UPI0032EF9EB4